MSTVRFRYGFHPEGFDPLLALPSTQPATAASPASPTAIRRQDDALPSTVVDTQRGRGVSACPVLVVRPERAVARRRSGWGRFLWASVVLLSTGVAGTVWATSGASTTHPTEAPVLAFAPPTVIEPESMPSNEPPAPETADVEPVSKTVVQPPAASPPSRQAPRTPASPPVTTEPPQPSVSPVPPALPSVSLPPAVVWTPVATPEEPPKPPAVTPDTSVRRPTVVVRPEVKPTIKAAPTVQPRTSVAKPKVRPPIRGTVTKMTKVAQ